MTEKNHTLTEDDDANPYLDSIVWAAHKDGLEGLTPEQRDYLETYLWESGGEEFDKFYYDEIIFPDFGQDDLWILEDKIDQKRLVDLQAGASFSKDEEKLLQDSWLKNLEENPDDDITPGVWTDTIYASDGAAILTVRHCYGSGWDTNRTLVEVKAL